MSGVSPLAWLSIAWAVITAVFLVLMLFKSLISMKEEDQLFLDPAESHLETAQREILTRLNRITPFTRAFGLASAGLLILMGSMWVYRGVTEFMR